MQLHMQYTFSWYYKFKPYKYGILNYCEVQVLQHYCTCILICMPLGIIAIEQLVNELCTFVQTERHCTGAYLQGKYNTETLCEGILLAQPLKWCQKAEDIAGASQTHRAAAVQGTYTIVLPIVLLLYVSEFIYLQRVPLYNLNYFSFHAEMYMFFCTVAPIERLSIM